MIIAISQPTLYPWIGYFDIINKSDVFVFLDDVQLNRRSWQTRNRIKNPNPQGDPEIWLNIPVIKSGLDTLIKDAKIDNSKDWKRKHIGSLSACYGAAYRKETWIQELYKLEWEYLAKFNIEFIKRCCKFLDIRTQFFISSDLGLEGNRSHKLANICKYLGADTYLTPESSRANYLEGDKQIFDQAGVAIQYHKFIHPQYEQNGLEFVPYLSILDLILNMHDQAKELFINN